MLPVLFTNRWNDLFPALEELDRNLSSPSATMALDIRQVKDGWVIEAEVPGLSKDDLDINVENDVLTIYGQSRTEKDEKTEHYHVRERQFGRISRSIVLPKTADVDRLEAKVENGVLTLTIPVREEAKPRRIEVR